MTLQEQIVQLLPARSGHFVYESGHHGEIWLDLERLFLHPARVRPFAAALAERLRSYSIDAVCAPLVEGAFIGLMVAADLAVPFTYSEPIRPAGKTGLFTVSYEIPEPLVPELQGKRIAVVNDVINAGSAVRGTLVSLDKCGAKPIAIGTLAVYGSAAPRLAAANSLGLESLAEFPSRIWDPADCPVCAANASS